VASFLQQGSGGALCIAGGAKFAAVQSVEDAFQQYRCPSFATIPAVRLSISMIKAFDIIAHRRIRASLCCYVTHSRKEGISNRRLLPQRNTAAPSRAGAHRRSPLFDLIAWVPFSGTTIREPIIQCAGERSIK
jgi:hypothetical protein